MYFLKIHSPITNLFCQTNLSFMQNNLMSKACVRNIVDVHILWCTWGCSSWMWTGIRGDVRNPLSDVTPNSVLGGANSLSPGSNSLRGFRSRGKRIRSSQNRIRGDVTPNSGSHPTTAPPSASQDVNVDYSWYTHVVLIIYPSPQVSGIYKAEKNLQNFFNKKYTSLPL